MPSTTKTLTVCTVAGLVAATAYTVTLRASGWLWFLWVVLLLLTAAAAVSKKD